MRRENWLVASLFLFPSVSLAQGALGPESLLEYIQARSDLEEVQRRAYESEIRVRFGGEALEPQDAGHVEIRVAKEILSAAIFLQIPAKRAVAGAWDGYHGALDYVPPPIAVDYEILKFQGRPPKGRPIDLAFDFPKYYADEIAPDLVAYWEDALATDKVREWDIEETKQALDETRKLMRPLLLEKLRLLARLAKDRARATGRRQKFLEEATAEIEAELSRSFKGVAAKPEVLDRSREPFARLKLQLEATRGKLTDEDALLDPAFFRAAADREQKEREAREQRARDEARREAEERRFRDAYQRLADEAKAARERDEAERRERDADEREAEARARAEREAAEQERDRARLEELNRRLERESKDRARRRRELEERLERERKDREESLERQSRERDRRERESRELEARDRGESWSFDRIRARLDGVVGSWLGTPYLWGGSQKGVGTDCSGFTRGVMLEGFSRQLPRTSRDQFLEGQEVESAPDAGDLVFFDIKDAGQISHVGVALGNGKFAHAGTSSGVTRADLSARYFQRAYRGARRVIGQ
ncbi:MAG: C40 family peptidase [Deltaproteobacteria bacterium]|nr:C40 family peptidase [Deltaproteobacteria bacterium]